MNSGSVSLEVRRIQVEKHRVSDWPEGRSGGVAARDDIAHRLAPSLEVNHVSTSLNGLNSRSLGLMTGPACLSLDIITHQ